MAVLVVHELLIAVVPLVVQHCLEGQWASVGVVHGLSYLPACVISLEQG